MVDLPRAEIAMGEVLVFEVAIERFFGFQDSAMAAAGVATEVGVGAPLAQAQLNAAGQAVASITAAPRGNAVLQAIGAAIAAFEGVAVQKVSADFAMAGSCSWYARGVAFKPVMPLNDGYTTRAAEFRSLVRGREYRANAMPATGAAPRYQENRGMTR